jgi:glycogen synthase
MLSMQASVIVPVWNGASVIKQCLEALYQRSGTQSLETICIDNASQDESASLVARDFPQARLIRQPVNRGFAGGVNVGLAAANGELLILLNQDCMVHDGWLEALCAAFISHPDCGIAGCTIFDSSGSLNHSGAFIRHPDGYGVHIQQEPPLQPFLSEYVTGALFAIRRSTWQSVGKFDEAFFPRDFEEVDYCYRARHMGIETMCVPAAQATHIFSSREWQRDPVAYATNQHHSRYRFVAKHFSTQDQLKFFDVEIEGLASELYWEQAFARARAARRLLRALDELSTSRARDLAQTWTDTQYRQLFTGFAQVAHRAFGANLALHGPTVAEADPTFSLIINTLDRARPLQTLLHALDHQTYPLFEVIVVVGPTHDHTLEILQPYAKRVRVLRCPTANLGRSRNIGLLAARADMVAYIDDDAVPSVCWLEQLAQIFRASSVDATGGVVYAAYPKMATVQHRIGIISSLAEQEDVRASRIDPSPATGLGSRWVERMMGTNMAFRRSALLEIGGFDERYEWVFDEVDVAMRLSRAGKWVHPVKEAVVYHVPASSRNRVVFTYNFDWGRRTWGRETKAAIYFAIKNGRAAGDPAVAIALRCLQLGHGPWRFTSGLFRERSIKRRHLWAIGAQAVSGLMAGVLTGLGASRKLLQAGDTQAAIYSGTPVTPFQTAESRLQPHVDPITGYRPQISLIEPPLRVCLLSTTYPPSHYDGVGRLTHLMARGLFECGHSVHVLTLGDTDRVSFYDGAYVHELATRLERYQQYANLPNVFYALNRSHTFYEKIRQVRLNDGVQLVDSPLWLFPGLVTALSGELPVLVRLVTAMRQVATLHHEAGQDAVLMGQMEQLLIERATHLLPNTQATLGTARSVYSLRTPPERYSIVPYGVIPVDDDAARPFDLARASGPLTVLFVGRLEHRKGIRDLFAAIPAVLKQIPDVKFIIAGADNSRHDTFQSNTGLSYPAYFARHYAEFSKFVTFTGEVTDEELQRLYQACDLFVAPSIYESFGLVYLEAMNYAKPVIGCRAGGIPEVVADGQTGLLVEPEAPAALAEAMLTLLRSPQRLRELGLAGRTRLINEFTFVQMARNFATAYRHAIRAFAAQSAETDS